MTGAEAQNPMHPFEGINTPTLEIMCEEASRIVANPQHLGDVFDREARAARAGNHRSAVVALGEIEKELERRATEGKGQQNPDGSSVHDGGLYTCSSCDVPIDYYTWEIQGTCGDCQED